MLMLYPNTSGSLLMFTGFGACKISNSNMEFWTVKVSEYCDMLSLLSHTERSTLYCPLLRRLVGGRTMVRASLVSSPNVDVVITSLDNV